MGQSSSKMKKPKRGQKSPASNERSLTSRSSGAIRGLLPFVMDAEGRFYAADPPFESMWGPPPESFLHGVVTIWEILDSEDRQTLERALKEAVGSLGYLDTKFRIKTIEGQRRWVRMRGPVIGNEDGGDVFIRGFLEDVTKAVERELALERKLQAFHAALDSLDDGIGILSDDSQMQYMNQAMVGMVRKLGGDASEEAVLRGNDVFPLPIAAGAVDRCCGFEEREIPALGKIFLTRTFPVCIAGSPVATLVHLRDVTRLSRMERRLKEASFRVKIIAQAANVAPLGIFILEDDEEGKARFRFVNDAFCKITGYERDELLGMGVKELLYSEELQEVLKCYRKRLRGEISNSEYEMQILRKDGTPISVICMGASTLHEGIITTVGFLRDITRRKELQKSLELSQRLATLGKLSAEIAHEINNPMTSILTFNSLIDKILDQQPFPEHRIAELRDYISYTSSEAKRCAKISKSLLDFSREHDISLKEHSIHTILEKTLDILQHRTKFGSIKLVTSFGDSIPSILCDYHRIQQVFCNLLWNAIDAMPNGGILSVSTSFEKDEPSEGSSESSGGKVKVVVSDTGTGILPEDLDRIFEPFFSTKTEKSGVGLGLSVAYGIVKKHHGDILVQSQPGVGTSFTVLLPAVAESPPQTQDEIAADAG